MELIAKASAVKIDAKKEILKIGQRSRPRECIARPTNDPFSFLEPSVKNTCLSSIRFPYNCQKVELASEERSKLDLSVILMDGDHSKAS